MSLKPFGFSFKALGSPNEVQLYAEEQSQADAVFKCIHDDVRLIEKKYSRYLPDSIISRINAAAGLETIEVDHDTATLLDYANVCFQQSDGLFDITSGVLRRAWDFKRAMLPSKQCIQQLLPLVGWNKVSWNKPQIKLLQKGMEIDFGGIGKEYAVDHAAGVLLSHGIKHGLINFGGDLRAVGPHPDGSPWIVGISHPRDPQGLLGCVDVYHGAIATSGDYERYMEVEGVRYCHILSPKTGFPVHDFQSVTVFADSCLVAGSATTITMLYGEKKGRVFLEDMGLHSIRVNRMGKILYYPEKLAQQSAKYRAMKSARIRTGNYSQG